jgi:hypothetical protein
MSHHLGQRGERHIYFGTLISHAWYMTSQLSSKRTDNDVLPKDFDTTTGPIFLQPWFWLAIVGVIGMVALTIFG